MISKTARNGALQLFSLLVAGFVLLSLFAVYTGLAERSAILPVLLTLAGGSALRYVALYHRFSNSTYRRVALVPPAIGFAVSGAVAVDSLLSTVSFGGFLRLFQRESFSPGAADFLPEWWIAVLLVPAGALILLGAVVQRDTVPYPKPSEIETIATSPVYFGLLCSFFGLWAVLFVGIAIQRVVIIAPIFEELLKFGVALLLGSTLFGRSLAARIGVAVVVGALFGLIEHATTYPMEGDRLYLFRTAFHSVTTVLSVSGYTLFESRAERGLQWIAPAYSVLLHFFNNTFAVLSGLLSVAVLGSPNTVVQLVYGSAGIVVAAGLLCLVFASQKTFIAIYRPLEYVLSDLV